MTEQMPEKYFIVAVWWPKDQAYGGASRRFGTIEEAERYAQEDLRLNYGFDHNPIHIIEKIEPRIAKVIKQPVKEQP